jgi:MerR family copper efflux transcriptional regulator
MAHTAEKLDCYLTVKAAAAYLGVSPSTLRNWDRAGKLSPQRHPINRYRLYRRVDLEALLRVASGPTRRGANG